MKNKLTRPIFETAHFRVEPCRDCRIPGYLILVPKVPVRSFAEMAPAALKDLGVALGRACAAMESVIKPERIYFARFGEGSAGIHFHLFPRTAELLQAYLLNRDDEHAPLSGPLILDWARKRYRVDGVAYSLIDHPVADHPAADHSLVAHPTVEECENAATALREWSARIE